MSKRLSRDFGSLPPPRKSGGPVMRFNFSEGSGIAIGEDCYRFVERVRDVHRSPVFRHLATDEPRTIPDSEIRRLIKDSHIKFLTAAEVVEAEATGTAPRGPAVVYVEDIRSEWERERVQRYFRYCLGWDRAGRPAKSDPKLAPIIDRVAREEGDEHPPSTRTLRRILPYWVARGCALEGLISNKNLCGAKSQITDVVREIILDVIWEEYLTLERPAVTDCFESVRAKIHAINAQKLPGDLKLSDPSIRQLHREIHKIDKFTIKARREGTRAAMLKFAPRYTGVDVKKHNHRWELDSTVVDLMLVDGQSGTAIGRPTITVVIDCYTRMIAGFYIGWEAESFVTFVAAMRHALQPKDDTLELYPEIKHDYPTLGPAEYVAVDNHSAYTSEDCRRACEALRIDLQFTPVLKPWFRPIIERFFNTLTHKTFQRVPGTTFSNIFERNSEKPPETIAVATLEELRMVVTKWIVDEYHYTRHRGIKTAPASLWDESTRLHATTPPPSLERMKTALALVVERVPQHYGIEWESMLFNSAAVANLIIEPGAQRKVRIAINHDDLSSVMMHDPGRKEWIAIPRVKPRLVAGEVITYGQHCLIEQLRKERMAEFMGEDSYSAAHDFVARFVDTKRDSKSAKERRRAASFRFPDRRTSMKSMPTLDEAGSGKSVSEDIFGDTAEAFAPPAAEQATTTGEAAETRSTRERRAELSVGMSAPFEVDPAATGPVPPIFVPADDDVDLNAAAAALGIKTYTE